jgi:arylsulfatase A-like enzyme
MTIEGHCTDITGDLGIEFLKTRPEDKPFFLMLHQKSPHRAWEPDERNKALFKDRVIPEPETLFDDYSTRPTALPENQQTVAKDLTRRDLKLSPPEGLTGREVGQWLSVKPTEVKVEGKVLKGRDFVKWKYQRYMRDYLACVQGVDDNVGKILNYLETSGLDKNTIVVYPADNGWVLGDQGLYDKRFMYEAGLKVPLLTRGPGIKKGIAPDQFVSNIDLAPTFLDLAGLPIPSFMQGRSLVPLLKGESPKDWRETFYYRYYHSPGHHNTIAHYGVRTKTHKLIYFWDRDAYELFDLVNDPNEQHNLLFSPCDSGKPEVEKLFKDLKTEIVRLQKEFKDEGQYASPSQWPKGSSDRPAARQAAGKVDVARAMSLSVDQ